MKTKDYGLMSLLICKGHTIIKREVDSLNQVWFHFADTIEIQQLENAFYMNSVSVAILDFITAQRNVKNLINLTMKDEYEKTKK